MHSGTLCGLGEHPFFAEWTSEEVALIRDSVVEFDAPAGKILFEIGEGTDGCYLVEGGSVALFANIDGRLQEVDRRGPGDSFGEVSMITGEPHRMRAVVAESAKLARIPVRGVSGCLFGEHRCPLFKILRPMVRHMGQTAMLSAQKVREKERMAMVGRMVNDIVHDFKSPFQTIALGTETIGRLTHDRQIAKLCSAITAQVDHMLVMAKELGEFSRGQEGMNFEKVRVVLLEEELREVCASVFARKDMQVSVELPDVEAEISAAGLVRVLQNLLNNASEAMPKGGRVEMKAVAENGWLSFTFSDNGPGIPEPIRDTFWQPFVTMGKKGGVGLGTAIVRSIVEGHGGRIRFETGNGRGTDFFFSVPLSRSTLPVPPPEK